MGSAAVPPRCRRSQRRIAPPNAVGHSFVRLLSCGQSSTCCRTFLRGLTSDRRTVHKTFCLAMCYSNGLGRSKLSSAWLFFSSSFSLLLFFWRVLLAQSDSTMGRRSQIMTVSFVVGSIVWPDRKSSNFGGRSEIIYHHHLLRL